MFVTKETKIHKNQADDLFTGIQGIKYKMVRMFLKNENTSVDQFEIKFDPASLKMCTISTVERDCSGALPTSVSVAITQRAGFLLKWHSQIGAYCRRQQLLVYVAA